MNILENIKKLNFQNQIKEANFTDVEFVNEEIVADKLRFVFALTTESVLFSIDIMIKGKNTIQFMTGITNNSSSEQNEQTIENVLAWFYRQIYAHPLFRLRIKTNGIRFKFVKANGNILYHHHVSFLEKK